MSDAAQPLLSYSAWRAEAARISSIAQSVAADERLTALLTAVMPTGEASAAAATPAAPTSFFSQLFASAAAPDAARGVPWCASLAHLLTVAELPPALTAETSSQESATTTAPHPISSARRHLSRFIAAVAACSDNNTPHATAAATRTGPTLASSSHALMPTLTTSPASSHDTTFHTTSLTKRTTAEGGNGSIITAVSRASVYDDRDDAEDDGGFDRMFARLKQQAVERRQQQQQQQQQQSSARRTTDTTAAAPSPPPPLRRASTDANTTSSGGVAAPPITLAGQQAARAAMDAADALLLRARQQNQLSTTPSGRIVEAETLLLHAAVCEESIVYTDRILHAVRTLLEREGGCQEARRESEDGMRRRRSTLSASRDTTDTSQAEDDSCVASHAWAAAVASSSPRRLTGLLRSSTAARMSGSFAASPHGLDSSFDHRLRSSMSASSAAAGGPSRVASPVGAPATMHAASASASPASAASAHFYRASPTASFATAAARPRLPHELVALLAQWRQLTEAQQRSVRCAEVHDYVHAGRLFLGAAAERAQLGCDATPTGKKEKAEGLVHGPAAELAAHGVTHLLRACGVLLADPLLEQDVVYPPSLLEEVPVVAAAAAAAEGSALDAAVVVPPPLVATPHAPRVWLLLSQLAGFVERHRLELPWDTPASQHRATSSLKSSFVPPLHTPIALPRGPTSTVQMLWEVAAAALLCRTEDALRIIHAVVTHTTTTITSAAAATSISPRQAPHSFISLHDLLAQSLERGKEVRPVVRPVVQPGTLPLCLHALRRASAAAVWSKHYAEALRNAELALLLLDDASTQWNTEVSGGGAEDAATMNQKKKIDYRKVARWSSVTRVATCVPSLAWLEAWVHFHLLRLLLLLLSAPLTAGDAVTRLLRQGELMRPLSTKRTATEGEEESGGAAKQNESDAVGEPMRSSSKSNSSSSDVHAQYVPPGPRVTEPSAVAEVATVLQQILDALQRIGDEIHVAESESGRVAVVEDDMDGRNGEGQQQQRAVLACMPLPRPARRLSAALSSGDEAVDADGIATSSADDAAHSSTVVLPDEATLTSATTGARRVTCRLPSSSCYQRLKQKYQGTEPQQKEVRSLFSTTPSDVAQENIASPLQQPSPSVVACETSTPDGDDDAQTTPAPLSHAMTQLHEVVRDILVVVCLLTMPLRARSTNTITADTLLPTPFCGGKVREESAGQERGYDRQCTHAQHALNEVEGRLERCLRRLGARDRILFTLLRRLRVEILFPAACGPLV